MRAETGGKLDDKNARDVLDNDDGLMQDEEDHTTSHHQDADETRLLRRLDMHMIPLIMGLYLFSFLDR
jgi:hypothetical protein